MKKWFKLFYPLLIFPLLVFPTEIATNDHIASFQMSRDVLLNHDWEKAERATKSFYYDGDREVLITTVVLLCITIALLIYNGLKIDGMVKRMVFYLVTFAIAYVLSGWFYNYNFFYSYWYVIFPEIPDMNIRPA